MRTRSDKTEVLRLRSRLRNLRTLLAGVVASTPVQQEWVNYSRRIIEDTLKPRPARRPPDTKATQEKP